MVEGDAAALVQELSRQLGSDRISDVQEHGAFGTVAFQLDGIPLDLATAREEEYPAPAENPMVRRGTLQADLARRDFTINALALDLVAGELIDLHHGLEDLVAAQLRFCIRAAFRTTPPRVDSSRSLRGAARFSARAGEQ